MATLRRFFTKSIIGVDIASASLQLVRGESDDSLKVSQRTMADPYSRRGDANDRVSVVLAQLLRSHCDEQCAIQTQTMSRW
jgi:hypothetical protein